jgi:KAP family P-loop domain
MDIKNIEVIFEDYLKADKTQYAILLNGSWGCGKTYFWKHSLNKIAEENKFKTIYISLNGISKIDALDHMLFIKLIPFISNQENNKIKNATILLTNMLNQTAKYFTKSSLSDMFQGVTMDSYSFSNYVICFDDLERCQIPVKEVLGFINNYIEHKNLKTIFLADETNIDSSQKGYDSIKEKVIGRVLNFELNIEETLPFLFKRYESDKPEFYNFMLSQKQVLVGILKEYKQNNLRIISFYLDVLVKLFPCFNNVDEKYVQELILFSALITIEFKKGNLKSSDYKDPKGVDLIDEYYHSLNITRTSRDTEKNPVEKIKMYKEVFYETYLDKRIKNYFYYQSVYSYILSGYINLSDLEVEIKKRYPEVISQEFQEFRRLLNYKFRELSDIDFKELSNKVLLNAKEGKYHIYDYPHIADFYYYFSKNHLITESVDSITNIIIEGLNIAKSKKKINDNLLENLLRFGHENPNVTKIQSLVKAIHLEIKKDEYILNSNELIDCLIYKDEYALAEIFEKHKFSKELFQYIDDDILFNTILALTNKQLFNFIELLKYRYEITNIGEYLFEDNICLTTLKDKLFTFLKGKEDIQPLRKFHLCELETTLLKIIQHLNDTKK